MHILLQHLAAMIFLAYRHIVYLPLYRPVHSGQFFHCSFAYMAQPSVLAIINLLHQSFFNFHSFSNVDIVFYMSVTLAPFIMQPFQIPKACCHDCHSQSMLSSHIGWLLVQSRYRIIVSCLLHYIFELAIFWIFVSTSSWMLCPLHITICLRVQKCVHCFGKRNLINIVNICIALIYVQH